VRGHYGSDYLNHPQRLQQPLVRGNGDMEAASWEEALDQTAQRLRDIARQWGPEAIGFYGSTQCSNEENYLFQKLARQAIGSAHVDNGARLQAASSLLGLKEVLGVGAATNPMEDLETAQVILLIGAQPTESHPVAGYHIKRAVRYRGCPELDGRTPAADRTRQRNGRYPGTDPDPGPGAPRSAAKQRGGKDAR
jgi:formate dehydrogenase major subunit